MNFEDAFKTSFLENMANVTVLDTIFALSLAVCIGVFIFFIYKKTYKGVMYSASFAVTLIALTMITTVVILAVTSNVILSLGMVGALSIVRFRTAIKEPLDIAFLFWSIAAGIVLAAGLLPLAVFGSVLIGVVLLVFVNYQTNDLPYILILTFTDETAERDITKRLTNAVKKKMIKSKTVNYDSIEINYEIRLKNNDTGFLNSLRQVSGVRQAVLVSYNGDYMG
ncbi:MAG: DUF4956 domain-containing protein [Clostridiales bacterium]|jgi:uncharacterized membrane protein YhiD involved in acid resistance|nr:DUF4956 domain-containing protein [Clostridiales bacterium]